MHVAGIVKITEVFSTAHLATDVCVCVCGIKDIPETTNVVLQSMKQTTRDDGRSYFEAIGSSFFLFSCQLRPFVVWGP